MRKVSRQNADGTFISYLQIAENVWDKEKRRSRVRVVCTLERAVFAMVANRCLAPRSKLGCYERWMSRDIYFPEGRRIRLHHLYWAMDFLAEHKSEIEEALYWRLVDLLSLDVDLIFYDTTSIHFESVGMLRR